jgi:hypothetical protein
MLSDDKISHLSHIILQKLMDDDTIDITEDAAVVRRAIKRTIASFMRAGQEIDTAARRKIESLSRPVSEGSPEWDALYARYFREEETRRGLN